MLKPTPLTKPNLHFLFLKLDVPVDLRFNYFSVVSYSLNLDKQTVKGSTALHYCCLTDNSECLKLLLRGKASIDIGMEQ